MFDKLPETLKKEAGFLLWKYEERDVNQTKVPYRINGFKADPTKRSHFSAFEAVKPVFDKGRYDGIGISVEPRFSAIDIDDCVADDGNKLTVRSRDCETVLYWKDRSRSEYWTDEMKAEARKKTMERSEKKNG